MNRETDRSFWGVSVKTITRQDTQGELPYQEVQISFSIISLKAFKNGIVSSRGKGNHTFLHGIIVSISDLSISLKKRDRGSSSQLFFNLNTPFSESYLQHYEWMFLTRFEIGETYYGVHYISEDKSITDRDWLIKIEKIDNDKRAIEGTVYHKGIVQEKIKFDLVTSFYHITREEAVCYPGTNVEFLATNRVSV